MTTNITALVQRLKVAAKNGCCHTLFPDDCLALVEALEKEKTKADVYDMLRDDYGLREKGVGLADFVDWQAKRIAELESRTVTVKLPEGDERDDLVISITEEIAHLQRCVERYRKEEMASTTQEMEQRLLVQKIALSVLNSGAGIKWEAE